MPSNTTEYNKEYYRKHQRRLKRDARNNYYKNREAILAKRKNKYIDESIDRINAKIEALIEEWKAESKKSKKGAK